MKENEQKCILPGALIKKVIVSIDIKTKVTFLSTVLIGLASHMYMITNKLPNYDDSFFLFQLGAGTGSGRWFLDYLRGNSLKLQGNFSMPWLNGFITIILIAASACIICAALEIKDQLIQILIGGLMISFPAVTALFIFMYTSVPYGLAILLVSCAVFAASRKTGGGGGYPMGRGVNCIILRDLSSLLGNCSHCVIVASHDPLYGRKKRFWGHCERSCSVFFNTDFQPGFIFCPD